MYEKRYGNLIFLLNSAFRLEITYWYSFVIVNAAKRIHGICDCVLYVVIKTRLLFTFSNVAWLGSVGVGGGGGEIDGGVDRRLDCVGKWNEGREWERGKRICLVRNV